MWPGPGGVPPHTCTGKSGPVHRVAGTCQPRTFGPPLPLSVFPGSCCLAPAASGRLGRHPGQVAGIADPSEVVEVVGTAGRLGHRPVVGPGRRVDTAHPTDRISLEDLGPQLAPARTGASAPAGPRLYGRSAAAGARLVVRCRGTAVVAGPARHRPRARPSAVLPLLPLLGCLPAAGAGLTRRARRPAGGAELPRHQRRRRVSGTTAPA